MENVPKGGSKPIVLDRQGWDIATREYGWESNVISRRLLRLLYTLQRLEVQGAEEICVVCPGLISGLLLSSKLHSHLNTLSVTLIIWIPIYVFGIIYYFLAKETKPIRMYLRGFYTGLIVDGILISRNYGSEKLLAIKTLLHDLPLTYVGSFLSVSGVMQLAIAIAVHPRAIGRVLSRPIKGIVGKFPLWTRLALKTQKLEGVTVIDALAARGLRYLTAAAVGYALLRFGHISPGDLESLWNHKKP